MTLDHDQPVPFGYGVVVCESFDEVLAGGAVPPRPLTDLVALTARRGSLLLQARGGAGKTTALAAAAAAAASEGVGVMSVAAIDFAMALPENATDEGAVLDALAHAAGGGTTPQYLLDSPAPLLLLLDGVNEIPGAQAQALLNAVQHLVERAPSLRAVVTDRLHRRQLPTRAWTLATLTAVPRDEVRALIGTDLSDIEAEALSLPFYLDSARRHGSLSRTGVHEERLRAHASQTAEDIARLAAATFGQYRATGSRRMDPDTFAAEIPESQILRLRASGILTPAGPLRFTHHLISDYLAARHLAQQPGWNRSHLDTLTLKASSFDALGMLLELAPAHADELVVVAYDWNFYAAAWLLAEARLAAVAVAPGLETAVLGMLGERRFDRVRATAVQVTDALRAHGTDYARSLLTAPDRDAVCEVVRQASTESAWSRWRELLLRPDGTPAGLDDVALLAATDPLLGWTTANMLRRSSADQAVWDAVVALLRADDGTVRWRAAHALGRHPEPVAVDSLLRVLTEDEYSWARYGALRSLVELAADAEPGLRASVLDRISAHAGLLADRPELARETERVLDLTAPPPGWADATAVIVEKLWAEAATVDEQDRWSALGERLRRAT